MTRFNPSAVPSEVCLPSLASLIAQRTVAPPTQPANPWRAVYDPAGDYRIVCEPNPDNPPKGTGKLHRATFVGARKRVLELNEGGRWR